MTRHLFPGPLVSDAKLMDAAPDLAALLPWAIKYLTKQANTLEECSANNEGEYDDDDSTAEQEVCEVRAWVRNAQAALAKAGLA